MSFDNTTEVFRVEGECCVVCSLCFHSCHTIVGMTAMFYDGLKLARELQLGEVRCCFGHEFAWIYFVQFCFYKISHGMDSGACLAPNSKPERRCFDVPTESYVLTNTCSWCE